MVCESCGKKIENNKIIIVYGLCNSCEDEYIKQM